MNINFFVNGVGDINVLVYSLINPVGDRIYWGGRFQFNGVNVDTGLFDSVHEVVARVRETLEIVEDNYEHYAKMA